MHVKYNLITNLNLRHVSHFLGTLKYCSLLVHCLFIWPGYPMIAGQRVRLYRGLAMAEKSWMYCL